MQTYVHRSGRTARAKESGISIMLIDDHDMRFYKRIISNLNRCMFGFITHALVVAVVRLIKVRAHENSFGHSIPCVIKEGSCARAIWGRFASTDAVLCRRSLIVSHPTFVLNACSFACWSRTSCSF